ncbi:MAG: hypothetical protein LUC38_03795 [Oscillospiraceae bacterium]|nr:hypothetical protein [Oscillospiraceae bacterium]
MKKYESAKMEIVLFDDCAWTDVVTSDTAVYPATKSSRSLSLSLFDPDNWYGDQ